MIAMNIAEANEVAAMWIANAMTAFSIYLTFTFAYLTIAYIAGKDLPRFQAFSLSTLYIAGAFISLLSCIDNLNFLNAVLQQSEALQSAATLPTKFWIYYIAPLLIVGVFVSLYFMWDVRHPKTE
jgi:hypothetical protein